MIHVKIIRETPQIVKKDLRKRGLNEKVKEVDEAIKLDEQYRKYIYKVGDLRHERNKATDEINQLKKQGKDIKKKIKEVKDIPDKIEELEGRKARAGEKLKSILMNLPNILADDVPPGKGEEDNAVVSKSKAKPGKAKVLSHVDVLKKLDLADIERAANIAGARFYFMKNELVMLDQALMKFSLDFLHKKRYTLVEPPFMMKRQPYEGVTDLETFDEMLYKIENEDLYLIATSEHPIAAMHMNETFNEKDFPIKYAGISTCFRKEAGSHGKDTKGIFRVHHFNKIEQFIFCRPEDSEKYFEEILRNAEELYKKLKLPYRIVRMCASEVGTIASKKYDIELWMPAQQKYREVVSCSNCTAYQSTRLNIRYRHKKGNEIIKDNVHTLNSTAIATSRTIVSILENCQNKDGTVNVPSVLIPYMNGIKVIGKRG